MVVGHTRSWTPRLRYEATKSLTLPREATTAVTPRGMQDGMSTYAGTVRGVDKGRSAHLWLLGRRWWRRVRLTFASAGAGPSSENGRSTRSQTKRVKFFTSPTKEGTTLEMMNGDSSSVGIWLRHTPFSVKLANERKPCA